MIEGLMCGISDRVPDTKSWPRITLSGDERDEAIRSLLTGVYRQAEMRLMPRCLGR